MQFMTLRKHSIVRKCGYTIQLMAKSASVPYKIIFLSYGTLHIMFYQEF